MKKTLLIALATVFTLVGCSKGGDGPDDSNQIMLPNQSQENQQAYANNETTGSGFTFIAKSSWSANVTESTPTASVATTEVAPITRTGGLLWLSLKHKDTETYSGGAGSFTLTVELTPNYTGKTRTATITITSGNDKISITVTQDGKTQTGVVPEDPNMVKSITLNKDQMTITSGESEELIATISPSTTTNQNVIWTSSDPEVASVDYNSKYPNSGLVFAKSAGTTEITATTEDGGKTAKCIVTVKIKIPGQVKGINGVTFVFNPTEQVVVGREIGSSAKYYAERFTFEGGTLGGGGKLTHANGENWDYADAWDNEYIYDGDYLKQINYKIVPEPEFNNYTYHIFNTWEDGNLTRISHSIGSSSAANRAVLEYTDILHPQGNLDINLYTVFLWGSFGNTCLSPEYYAICDNNLGARSKYLVRKVTYSSEIEPTASALNFERTFRYEIYAGQVSAIYYTDKTVNDANPQQERKLCDFYY